MRRIVKYAWGGSRYAFQLCIIRHNIRGLIRFKIAIPNQRMKNRISKMITKLDPLVTYTRTPPNLFRRLTSPWSIYPIIPLTSSGSVAKKGCRRESSPGSPFMTEGIRKASWSPYCCIASWAAVLRMFCAAATSALSFPAVTACPSTACKMSD